MLTLVQTSFEEKEKRSFKLFKSVKDINFKVLFSKLIILHWNFVWYKYNEFYLLFSSKIFPIKVICKKKGNGLFVFICLTEFTYCSTKINQYSLDTILFYTNYKLIKILIKEKSINFE